MRYYCDICLRDIKKKSKLSHLKSESHKESEKYKHIKLSLRNVDIKDVDENLYLYMKDHNKKVNQYLLESQFKLIFKSNPDFKYLMTDMIINTTNILGSNYLREAIDNLKEEGYDFNQIAEMNNITLAHKRDMTYDFYLKHNISAFEWKLNALINKGKNLISKLPGNWRHPNERKFDCYRN